LKRPKWLFVQSEVEILERFRFLHLAEMMSNIVPCFYIREKYTRGQIFKYLSLGPNPQLSDIRKREGFVKP